MTGITRAFIDPFVTRKMGVSDPRSVGLAMGIASHGIGTARALQIGETAGGFAGLSMSLNGIWTGILLPLVANLF
jgi:putative effector of murein hydrolase